MHRIDRVYTKKNWNEPREAQYQWYWLKREGIGLCQFGSHSIGSIGLGVIDSDFARILESNLCKLDRFIFAQELFSLIRLGLYVGPEYKNKPRLL